jgi:hypothetical protein
MINPQMYAIDIEHILCDIFNCERYGFGGAVNSDTIRKHPYLSMTQGLAYLYANADGQKKKKIDKFIDDYSFYSDMSIDELLSFETNSKQVGITTYEIEKSNGKEQMEYIIEQFEATVS